VACSSCGKIYRWSSDLDLREAECEKCRALYNVEFGFPVAP
jgi:DNA-directed RNA polymerase subunit RPC12/RpoP